MNVSVGDASLAATRSMIYGRRGAASNTHPPIRSHPEYDDIPEYDDAPDTYSTYIEYVSGACAYFYLSFCRCSRPTIPIRASAAAIFRQPTFRGIGIHPTVGTRQSITEARSRSESLDISEAVISQSCYFPKPLFPEAVNHHRKRYCQ